MLKRAPHMGCMCHVWVVEGRREKRLQRASVGGGRSRKVLKCFELLGGALFSSWQGLVIGLKRAPHMGCMMPSVEGLRENRSEEGTPYAVGVHVAWRS